MGRARPPRSGGSTAGGGVGVPALRRRPAIGRPGSIAEGDAHQQGQAAVELALALPLVAMLLLAVVQVGLVVRDQVLTVHAAREAARAAAVDPDPRAARAAALAGAALEPGRLTVRVTRSDQSVAVVTYRAPTDLPLIGPLVPDPVLRAKAAMRTER